MLHRPGQQELIKPFAFTRPGQPPAQPVQYVAAVVTARASLPAAVPGEQPGRGGRFDVEGRGQPGQPSRRAAGQVIGHPAKPWQGAQLDRDPDLVVRSVPRPQPTHVSAAQGEERDHVLVGNLGRPVGQSGQLSLRQEPNRHPSLPAPARTPARLADGRLRYMDPTAEWRTRSLPHLALPTLRACL